MAKYKFRTNKELLDFLKKDSENAAKILSEAAESKLYDNVDKKLYQDMDEGNYYNRTNQILDSITSDYKSSINSYKIYFDGRKITKKITKRGMFNAHADFFANKVNKDDLIGWLEEGHYVPNTDARKGAKFMKSTKTWIENVLRAIMNDSESGLSLSASVEKNTVNVK